MSSTLRVTDSNSSHKHAGRLTLPSPKERVLKKSEVKVLSFGEDLGEAKLPVTP